MLTIKGELTLLVDDEPNIIQLAQLDLEREGFRIHTVSDGRSALDAARREWPALIVLDIMLPELDGLEVRRKLRAEENPLPILMLTARDEDVDKIIGLEFGADDFLTRQFNPQELVAHIKAILRRSDRPVQPHQKSIHIGNLVLDPARREVNVGETKVELHTQEFERNNVPWSSICMVKIPFVRPSH